MTNTLAASDDSVPLARSWDIILIGIVVYGLLACGLLQGTVVFPFGQNIYDEYFLAILNGHLDLPARVAQYEGHYTPEGVAYLYHGVAPLIPRFLFGWIWPFQNWSLAPLSIWIWACLGTVCYHAAFLKACRNELGKLGSHGVQLSRYLSIAIWFSGPGVLLAASTSFYHEPVAMAFAATGCFVLIWTHFTFGDWPMWRLALPSALIAAVTLHARPNVAIGLYLAAVLVMLCIARTSFRQHWMRMGLALAILGTSGLGYLALNSARFGSLTQTHGSFTESEVQYGFVFWGAEDQNSERATAFKEHGKFNIKRVPHNATIYVFDLPKLGNFLDTAREKFHALGSRILAGDLGFIRVEAPYAGLIFLWPLWLAFCAFSPVAKKRSWKKMAIPLAGAVATTVLTLAYGTITLRYRIDLWPFISLLALLGVSAILPKLATNSMSASTKWAAGSCFLVGLLISALTVSQLQLFFQTGPQIKPSWSLETCGYLARSKNFSPADTLRICQAPRIDG